LGDILFLERNDRLQQIGIMTFVIDFIRYFVQIRAHYETISIMENLNDKKLLIIRLSSIGDTIHGLPVLSAIKQTYPQARVSWLVEKESSFLLQGNPLLDKVFIFDKESLKKGGISLKTMLAARDLISTLRKEHFDIAIDLQGLLKSGILTYLSGARRRTGFKNTRECSEIFLTEKIDAGNLFAPDEHIILKNLKLAEYLGARDYNITYPLPPETTETRQKLDNLLKALNPELPVVILIPSTLWKSKLWLTSYWQELVSFLTGKTNIIFTGSQKDTPLIKEITDNIDSKYFIDLTGKTSLVDLPGLFRRANLTIGVDTGPIHIAVAAEKSEIIAIMGPTAAGRTGPINHTSMSADLPCIPCNKKQCPLPSKHYMQCMKSITPDKVISKSIEILNLKH
jgi:heptosyltransferase-1